MSIYPEQKYQELRKLVEQQAGQRLPGERALAGQLGLPRSGVRVLLDALEAEGLVRRQQGSGTYALDRQAKRLKMVALLIDEELKLGDDPFFSLLVDSFQGHLQAEGIGCLIERMSPGWQPRRGYEGAITLGQAGKMVLEKMQQGAQPLVCLFLNAHPRAGAPVSIFQLADREAGYEAAQRLLARGCNELFFVGKREITAARERLAGAEEAANARSLALRFLNCSLNYTAGLRLGQELAIRKNTTPGLIAANDWLAVGLRAGLSSRFSAGLPDIQITSFDGLPITADSLLRIDSLVAPIQTIAADAVSELHRLLTPVPGRIVRYPFHWRA